MKLIPTHQLKSLNARNGFHWFDPDTMRFFQSRVAEHGYLRDDGSLAFFVSSEKQRDSFTGFLRTSRPRKYSVRVINMTTGDIDTVGEFQQYRCRSTAHRYAKLCASL